VSISVSPDDVKIAFGEEEAEAYRQLFLALLRHIEKSATVKLRDRERVMFFARLGINESPKKLNEIGEIHSITRERVRQILKKAMRKMGNQSISTDERLLLQYEKVQIVSAIAEKNAGGFLSYLLMQKENIELINFICAVYLPSETSVALLCQTLEQKLSEKRQKERQLAISQRINCKIYEKIVFPGKKRTITEEDFGRLKSCEANIQKTELEEKKQTEFLAHATFRQIKTRALSIPFAYGTFFPTFQCLTHENCLVLIDFVPAAYLSDYLYFEKVEAIEAYCKRYGFGYLIIEENK